MVYNEKNGNCDVPTKQGSLGTWVSDQRTSYRKGKLSPERIARLEGIAFNWGKQKMNKYKPWEERFDELVGYKEKNGTCNVPQKQGSLGTWVKEQRKNYRKGKLLPERTSKLEDVGFVWKTKRGGKA